MEVRTSHEGCSRLECGESQAIYDITNDIMSGMSAKLAVDECQSNERYACVKGLHAVPIGVRPYDRNEQIPKDNCVAESNQSSWDRAVGFILGVFVKTHGLVRGHELQKVEPYPESSFWDGRNLEIRCSSDGEARLYEQVR